MDDEEILSPKKRRKKLDEKEKKQAKKDIEGEKSITYTYKDEKSSEKKE
ncbi:MAG: hypothetical protein LUQ24_07220 [Methanobacterium sp.]|jgi:hypothetical protein|nr:hypothetical protein [Methanobacterium sp.]